MARKKTKPASEVEIPQFEVNDIRFKKHVEGKLLPKQRCFLEDIGQKSMRMMFVNGPAGTAKTFLSVMHALQMLSENPEHELLYVRTNAESGESRMGTLPGDEGEKLSPFLIPLHDKLEELLEYGSLKGLTTGPNPRVHATAVNYLRGSSWRNKVVIADEAQNFSFGELVTLITRVGHGTKLIICGDFMQSDIGGKSGFQRMFRVFDKEECRRKGIGTFQFGKEDIVRDKFLQYVIGEIEKELQPNCNQ